MSGVFGNTKLTPAVDIFLISTSWGQRSGILIVKRFRGGLVFKAHRLVYHSTLGLGVIKKKKILIVLPQNMHLACCR